MEFLCSFAYQIVHDFKEVQKFQECVYNTYCTLIQNVTNYCISLNQQYHVL